MDGVRMTPQDPSKKNFFFFLAKLIGWGGLIHVDDAGVYLQMDGCTHPDPSIWTHPARCSNPIHMKSSRHHPGFSRIFSVAFEERGPFPTQDAATIRLLTLPSLSPHFPLTLSSLFNHFLFIISVCSGPSRSVA